MKVKKTGGIKETMKIQRWQRKTSKIAFGGILITCMIIGMYYIMFVTACAKEENIMVSGDVYELDGEKTPYDISSAKVSKTTKTKGTLQISGKIAEGAKKEEMMGISVKRDYYNSEENSFLISYMYTDELFSTEEEDWHLVEDTAKKVDTISLKEKIKKGALILQTSKDGKTWVTTYTETNIFENAPNGRESFYSATNVQIANGCYYRVIIAYKIGRKINPKKVLFVNIDNYEYQKYMEVYTFYAYDETALHSSVDEYTPRYSLGSKARTKKYNGYYGETAITKKDPHYGWDLGEFFVSGYTDIREDSENSTIFLKNVGDQVTLWFNLKQDINCLDGKDNITIMEDDKGYDQYFETETLDFGHGALIIRKINYENVQEKPIIYTNYLEADAMAGANTKIDLFEEGDYEVALDYAINYDKTKVFGKSVLPEQAHYRIYFKFSIRNSNCMIYPRDKKTQSELANNAITENGFYLDLANSKYLQLNITKEILKDGATGLSKDTRFNKSAKEGDSYEEEGIYTITVKNQYTEQSTTKKIYVGKNNLLKAYIVTGLSISEIQDKLAQGATISEDGTIRELNTIDLEEQEINEEIVEESDLSMISEDEDLEQEKDGISSLKSKKKIRKIAIVISVTGIVLAGCFVFFKKKGDTIK